MATTYTTELGTATITQTATAQPVGECKPISLDQRKAEVDFRLIQVNPLVICWRNGEAEQVTPRRSTRLKTAYTWATDF